MVATFQGKKYYLTPYTGVVKSILCNGLKFMNHVGSIQDWNNPEYTTPQVYEKDTLLVAATINGNHQFVNTIFHMELI